MRKRRDRGSRNRSTAAARGPGLRAAPERLETRRLLSAAVIDIFEEPPTTDEPPVELPYDDGGGPVGDGPVLLADVTPNTAPQATNFTAQIGQGIRLSVSTVEVGSDADGDDISFAPAYLGTAAHGTVSINAEGVLVYQPDPAYTGTDSFTFRVVDTHGAVSNEATGNIIIDGSPFITVNSTSVSGTEGGVTVTNSGTFGDVESTNAQITLEASVGTVVKNDAAGTWSWSYSTDDDALAPPFVTITAVDSFTNPAGVTFALDIANVAPSADFVAGGTVIEGNAGSVRFENTSDPSAEDTAAGFLYSYDFDNDGTFEVSNTTDSNVTVPASYFLNGNELVARGRVMDKDGGARDYTVGIPILNVAPAVTINGAAPAPLPEGGTFGATGSFADPGTDIWTATVDYGDGTGAQPLALSGKNFTLSHIYADDGDYTVTVSVHDEADAGSATVAVDVTNVDPTVTIDGPTEGERDNPVSFTSSVTDPGDEAFAYAWTATDEDGNVVASGSAEDFTFTPTSGGTYTVALAVSDGDGGSDTASQAVEIVGNTVPVVGPISGRDSGVRGQLLSFSAAFTDPDVGDSHTATFDWGDGTTSAGVVSGGTASGSHVYAASGNYTVTLTVLDNNAGSASATHNVHVVAAEVQPDPAYPGKTALFVGGTDAAELIVVAPNACGDALSVWVDGGLQEGFAATGRVVVFAGGGGDIVFARGLGTGDVWIYGEGGDDILGVGNGGGLIFGGAGNDLLVGGLGRDIIVGGDGADRIYGNPGDDILISAVTTYDDRFAPSHAAAWAGIYAEWASGRTFQQRVDNLFNGTGTATRKNGSYFLNESTVNDDTSVDSLGTQDVLTGSGGSDWFIYKSGEDAVTSMTRVEAFDDLPIS